jgi:hypothetical protein
VNAADLSTLMGLLRTADPGPCDTADVDGDGKVGPSDIAVLVRRLFMPPGLRFAR